MAVINAMASDADNNLGMVTAIMHHEVDISWSMESVGNRLVRFSARLLISQEAHQIPIKGVRLACLQPVPQGSSICGSLARQISQATWQGRPRFKIGMNQ